MDDYDYDFRTSIRSEIDQLCAGGKQFLHQFCEEMHSEILGPAASFDRISLWTLQEWDCFEQNAETIEIIDEHNNNTQKERKIH